MSRFVLTAEVQMRGPTSSQLNAIASQIRSGLSGVNIPVNIRIPPNQQRVLNTVATDLKKVRRAAAETTDSFELLGKALSQNIRRYGAFTAATGAFIRLGIAISQSIGEAIDFETEIRKIAQGQDRAISSYAALKNEIDSLSKSLGVSSLSLASTSRILAQAGLSATEVKDALSALAKSTLAPTFGEINETTEASIAIMRQFGVQANELGGILGSVNKVAADFAVESEDIAAAVKLAGASFAASAPELQKGEKTFRQFIALFTSVRQTTRGSAESIATGLRTITTRLQRSGTIEYFKNLGIQLRDSEGQFIGSYEAIRKISKALEDIPGTDQRFTNIAELLGGYRQIDKTIPLLQQFAVAEKAYQSALKGRESLDKGLGLAQETLAVKFAKVREEFNSLVRKISENEGFRAMIGLALKLSSAMIKVVDSITPLLPLISSIGLIKIGVALPKIGRGFASDYKSVVGRKADGGKVHYFNKGGIVPGHGNSDTVPAMLTPGERIIPKKDVHRFKDGGIESWGTRGAKALRNAGVIGPGEKDQAFFGLSANAQRAKINAAKSKGLPSNELVALEEYFNLNSGVSQAKKTPKKPRVSSSFSQKIAVIKDNVVGAMFATTSANKSGAIKSSGEIFNFSSPKEDKKNEKKNKGYLQFANFGEGVNSVVFPAKYFYAKSAFDPSFNEEVKENFASSIDKLLPVLGVKVGGVGGNNPLAGGKNRTLRDHIINKIGINDVMGKVFEGALSSLTGAKKSNKKDDNFDFIKSEISGNKLIDNIFGEGLSKSTPDFIDAKFSANVGSINTLKKKVLNEIAGHSQYYTIKTLTKKNLEDETKEDELSNKDISDYFHVGRKGLATRKGKRSFSATDTPYLPYANGGLVPGSGNTDSVPMYLENGQYVIRKKAVEHIGASNLAKFASGGDVAANSLVMPGEYIFDKKSASRIGTSTLGKLNHADKFAKGGSVGGKKSFAVEGIDSSGVTGKQNIFADTEKEALETAKSLNIFVTKITETTKAVSASVSIFDKVLNAFKKTASITGVPEKVRRRAEESGYNVGDRAVNKYANSEDAIKKFYNDPHDDEIRNLYAQAKIDKKANDEADKASKENKANEKLERQYPGVFDSAGIKANQARRNKNIAGSTSVAGVGEKASSTNTAAQQEQTKNVQESGIQFAILTSLLGQTISQLVGADTKMGEFISKLTGMISTIQGAAIVFGQLKSALGSDFVNKAKDLFTGKSKGGVGSLIPGSVSQFFPKFGKGKGGKVAGAAASVAASIAGVAGDSGVEVGDLAETASDFIPRKSGALGRGASRASRVANIKKYSALKKIGKFKSFLGPAAIIGAVGAVSESMGNESAVENIQKGRGLTTGSAVASIGGGAVSGAATGAALGAIFGPVGSALGAFTGAVVGSTTALANYNNIIKNALNTKFDAKAQSQLSEGKVGGTTLGTVGELGRREVKEGGLTSLLDFRNQKDLQMSGLGAPSTMDYGKRMAASYGKIASLGSLALTDKIGLTKSSAWGQNQDERVKEGLAARGYTPEHLAGVSKAISGGNEQAYLKFGGKGSAQVKARQEFKALLSASTGDKSIEANRIKADELTREFDKSIEDYKKNHERANALAKQQLELTKKMEATRKALSAYAVLLDKFNVKSDKSEAVVGIGRQRIDDAISGNRSTPDFAAFLALAKKGETSPVVDSVLSGAPAEIRDTAKLEQISAKIARDVLLERSALGTDLEVGKGGSLGLTEKFDKDFKSALEAQGISPDSDQAKNQRQIFESEINKALGVGGDVETSGEKVGKLSGDKVKEILNAIQSNERPSLEAAFKFNHAINEASNSVTNLSKQMLNIEFESIAKMGANLEQYDATLSNVIELRGGTFDKINASQTNRSLQLGAIGSVSGAPIGPSGNSIVDAQRLVALKTQAESELSPLTKKQQSGQALSALDTSKVQQFEAQLAGATKGLELFGKGSENVIASLESKASELKQRREAAGSSALGYLTSDRKGKQQARKDLDFALRLSQGQVSLRDFSGNAGGVQTAKSLFGEKEAAQMFAKIPGLDKLFKPNAEEDKLHQQIMLENTARKLANDELAKTTDVTAKLREAMTLLIDNLAELRKPINQAQGQGANKGPDKEMILHGGTFQHNVEFTIKGMNPDLVDRKTVQEMLQVGINKWWDAQHDKAAKVPFNVEHQGAK